MEAIKAKKDVDDLQTILNNIPANATGQEDFNTDGIVSIQPIKTLQYSTPFSFPIHFASHIKTASCFVFVVITGKIVVTLTKPS